MKNSGAVTALLFLLLLSSLSGGARADWPLVELLTRAGGRRIVQRPYGEELPRIC